MTDLVTFNLALLGHKVEDVICGHAGVVVSVSFDLSGCVQAMVEVPAGKDKDSLRYWVDTKRLKRTSKKPVMDVMPFQEAPAKTERGAVTGKPLIGR